MTAAAFILIFFSVFLHVTWNMLSKGISPSLAFYSLMSLTASLVWFPFFLISNIQLTQLPSVFFLFAAGSICGEILYMTGLAFGYKKSDISLVYPVVRALPVMLVTLVTLIFGLGKKLDGFDLLGMLLITVGCLLMPLKSFREFSLRSYFSSVAAFIIMGAVGTTMYTVFDSFSIKIIRQASPESNVIDTLGYLFLIEFGLAVGELILVLSSREERAQFKFFLRRPLFPMLAGICSSGAYGLILFSMGFVSNISYLQAFRQMSLPLGFAAGVIILREKAYPAKLAGVAVIAAGLLILTGR